MEIFDELSTLIDQWLNDRKNNSLPLLAKLSGVSYPTVRRMQQKEGEPNLNNVISVLSIVTNPAGARAFMQKQYPEWSKIMEPSLVDFEPIKGLAEIERFTVHDFLVIGLASTKQGVSENEIFAKAGEIGRRALQKLVDARVVEQWEGRYVTTSRNVRTVGDDRILQSISLLCDIFDLSRVDSRGSLFRLKTEGVTKDTVLEIYKILYDASDRIQALMDDPAKKGDYVLGVGLVSTFLNFPEGEPNL